MTNAYRHRTDADPRDILLVEDNPGDVRLIEDAFSETEIDHRLHTVSDGQTALDALFQRTDTDSPSASIPLPDLVLLDLNLPEISGTEVLEAIRTDADLQCLPVLILTGSTADGDVLECYDGHANAYLTKPSGPDEFTALVETLESFWLTHVQFPPIYQ